MNTQYIETLRSEYIELHTKKQSRDLLLQENNIEKRDIKGYHGREILELLQNADDAYQKSLDQNEHLESELNVEICYNNNLLIVANTGTFFDQDGIKAVVQGNNSPKRGKYIGNKGTGFRSILNWADKVSIYSGEFAVQFSKDIANRVFDEIKSKSQIKKQLIQCPTLYIPMLAVPKNIDHDRPKDRTTIEITINEKKITDDYSVEKQLHSIDLRILLFLPNLSKISINIDGNSITYKRVICESQQFIGLQCKSVELCKVQNGQQLYSERYHLFNRDIFQAIDEDDIKKDIRMSIAVPVSDVTIKHIYSYFPLLDTNSPFSSILHATYALGDHRNTLNSSETNKIIVEKQLDFLIEIAQTYIDKGELARAYKILHPLNWEMSTIAKFNLKEKYVKKLSQIKMFKTVNNQLVSISSNPKIINFAFPDVLSGEAFNNILKYTDDANQNGLISFITNFLSIDLTISANDLCEIINTRSEYWTVVQQVEVFKWWNEHYKKEAILPKLLKTSDNNWLEYRKECYFLEGDFDGVILPQWVEVSAIGKSYQEELLKDVNTTQNETDNKQTAVRYICQNKIYPLIDFKYRDRNNIINAINSSIKENYNRSVEFVKWLWLYYGNKEINELSTPNVYLNFPSSKGHVVPCNKLYLGDEYDNDIATKIFSADFHAFPKVDIFDIDNTDNERFVIFIKHFGVLVFPQIEIRDITPFSTYDNDVKKDIKDSGIFARTNTEYVSTCKYRLPYIQNLEETLKSVMKGDVSMLDIISWILKDKDLSSVLDSEYCTSEAMVQYRGNNQRATTLMSYPGNIRNYILANFNNFKWIEINGEFYSPTEVLNGFNDNRNNHKFEKFIPVLTLQIAKDIASKLGYDLEAIIKVLNKFHFAKQVTNLPSDCFYGLMLALQNSKNTSDQELSRSIYRIIEQPSFKRIFEPSDNRDRFFNEGKILVKYQGRLQYYLAKESFLPSQKIIDKNSIPIVEKGPRTNNDNFVSIFGCKKYSGDYNVIEDTAIFSPLNDSFQSSFKEFIRYARAYSEKNENVSKYIFQLRVAIVHKIDIMENNTSKTISNSYSLIKSSSTNWYIVVNDSCYDKNKLSECIENIFANIANTPGFDVNKIGELFRVTRKEDREFLIKKEFGSLNVIDDKEYYNDVKVNFLETLNKINPDYLLHDCYIDFDLFSSTANAPQIIELFKELGIDIIDFIKEGFAYPIDISEYLKTELERFISREADNFMNVRFMEANTGEDILQKDFIKTIHRFKNYHKIARITNSVNCDPIKELKKEFGEWQNCEWQESARDVYNKNYDHLNPNNRFQSDIDNDPDAQRMIYFNQKEEFIEWLKRKEADDMISQLQDSNVVYSNYKEMMPEKVDINNVDCSESSSTPEYSPKTHTIPPIGSYNRKKADIKNSKLKQNGNIGELLIYNALVSEHGIDNVTPHSEAFIELGILKPGQASSGDYDIAYKGDDNHEIYVEVKTGERNMFYMSPGELEWAKKHSSSYYVYYVYDIHTKPKYVILPQKFWEDGDKFQMREIIEKIEFKL